MFVFFIFDLSLRYKKLLMKEMGFLDAIKSVVVDNYANFSGRARRSEYWFFVLANILFGIISGILGVVVPGFMLIVNIVGLALIIPSLAVCVRRLHDIGKSGWFYLLSFIPLIGQILIIIWFCQDSQPGENKWGANPKEWGANPKE